MEEQAGTSLNLTQQGRFSTATSKTDIQRRSWRAGLVESMDLIWAHSPNLDLPSLSPFLRLHDGIRRNGSEWSEGARKSSVQVLSAKRTTVTQEIRWAVLQFPDCLVVDWQVVWEEIRCATPGKVYKGPLKGGE